ncbi:alpha/beta hydrolase fold domain-containing protein [Peribacillus sp. SCS-155]|uniref:alpha/beta hydrolase n=1 Tax=Peribacillus sedimenti TaxID=3115297 RepID=UPI003905B22E
MVLNPKMKFFLENLLPQVPEGYAPTLEDVRSRFNTVPAGSVEQVKEVYDQVICGPGGDLPVRIYIPEGDGPFPVVVFFHGGGFVSGSIESHDPVCRSIVKASKHLLISVEYRLAPENPFPAAVYDCYAATKWAYEHADDINGDKNKVSVAGDSAGGNLAAVVSIMAKEEREFKVHRQVLLYPATDHYHPKKYKSYVENESGYFLTASSMSFFSKMYVLNANTEEKRYYLAPITAPDLGGLPPALIITAEYDPLRDEGEAYGEKLKEAGVEVDIKRYDGLIHGFFNLFSLMDSSVDIKEVYELIGDFLNAGTIQNVNV